MVEETDVGETISATNVAFVCGLCSVVDVALLSTDRLVGLVVKASASRAEGPGFESPLCRDFFGVESYQ